MVDKGLLERVKPIKVDYADSPMGAGFHISSNLKGDKSSCGSCSC
jgi:Fe-S cluster assembly iron-binding protein IscA